jgi:hypothetical protein
MMSRNDKANKSCHLVLVVLSLSGPHPLWDSPHLRKMSICKLVAMSNPGNAYFTLRV